MSDETKDVYKLYRSAYLDGESDEKLRFIRRSDHVQVLDLTTFRRTVQLEIEIDPDKNAKWLPSGLLKKRQLPRRIPNIRPGRPEADGAPRSCLRKRSRQPPTIIRTPWRY